MMTSVFSWETKSSCLSERALVLQRIRKGHTPHLHPPLVFMFYGLLCVGGKMQECVMLAGLFNLFISEVKEEITAEVGDVRMKI